MRRLTIGLFAFCFLLSCCSDDRDVNTKAREKTGTIFWYCFESDEQDFDTTKVHISTNGGTTWSQVSLEYNGQAYCACSSGFYKGSVVSIWIDTSDDLDSVETMEIRYCPADTRMVSTCSEAMIVDEVPRSDGIFKRDIVFLSGYSDNPLVARSIDKTGVRLPGDETRATSDDEPVTEPVVGTGK